MKTCTKKKYVSPICFEIVLKHHDKEVFKQLLDALIEEGVHDYKWKSRLENKRLVYLLYIDSCHANNLKYFANLLEDGEI